MVLSMLIKLLNSSYTKQKRINIFTIVLMRVAGFIIINTKGILRDLNAAINLPREGASSLGLADECGLGGFPNEQLVQEDTVRLSQIASVA